MFGVAASDRLGSLQKAIESPALALGVGEFAAELIDLATELHDLAAGCRQVPLRLYGRIDIRQSLLQEGSQPITLLRDCSAAPGAP